MRAKCSWAVAIGVPLFFQEAFTSGETGSGSPRSDDDKNFGIILPLEGIILEQVLIGRA